MPNDKTEPDEKRRCCLTGFIDKADRYCERHGHLPPADAPARVLPTTQEMSGAYPDLIGEMTTAEYMESIRGADAPATKPITTCKKCRGYGYTKGAPNAPYEQVECVACGGGGTEPIDAPATTQQDAATIDGLNYCLANERDARKIAEESYTKALAELREIATELLRLEDRRKELRAEDEALRRQSPPAIDVRELANLPPREFRADELLHRRLMLDEALSLCNQRTEAAWQRLREYLTETKGTK